MIRGLLLAVFCLLLGTLDVRGDVFIFELAGGGRIEGEWVNRLEQPRKNYIIKTELGEITLPREQIRKPPLIRSTAAIELDKLRHEYPDTPAGQWQLAEWCKTNRLMDDQKRFMQRVIELDPDHEAARRALGYNKYDGQWKTYEQAQLDKGLIRYKGKWILPQERENIEQDEKSAAQSKAWFDSVNKWRDWLVGSRSDEGKHQLLAIKEPTAFSALKRLLESDPDARVRIVCAQAMANIGNQGAGGAWRLLATRALEDSHDEVRLTCLDYLDDEKHPEALKLFLDSLRSTDNVTVNRAAVALQRLKDPSTVLPLMDALVTKHKRLVAAGTSPGSTTTSFSPQLGGGFSTGGGGPVYTVDVIQNQAVHDALFQITGVSFGFDVASWKRWHASQRPSPAIDVRRN